MRKRRTIPFAFTMLMLIAVLVFGQQPHRAAKGEIFKGRVERQDNTGLLLNITPCAYSRSGAQVVFFQVPYRSKALERVRCPGSMQEFVSTEVEQR